MNSEWQKATDAVRKLALDDIDQASDEEIRADCIAEGIDPGQLATRIAMCLDEILSAELRSRTKAASVAMDIAGVKKPVRPSLTLIRERIAKAFLVEPQLATSFRKGSRQTEHDLETLYDDLVLMGKITEAADDH